MPAKPTRPLTACLLAGCLALAGPAVDADDTEIFLGRPAAGQVVRPNILFVVDTSGSMTSVVTETTPYDPDASYAPGPNGACGDDSVVHVGPSYYPPGCTDANATFPRDKLGCIGALRALYGAEGSEITGRYSDRAAGWHRPVDNPYNGSWVDDDWALADRLHVECAADAGVHGSHGARDSWPRNGSLGPWTGIRDTPPIWQDWPLVSLFSAHYLRWYYYHQVTSSSNRLQVVKDVTRALVNSISGVNVGLMRFDDQPGNFNPTYYQLADGEYITNGDMQGGHVVYPVRPLDSDREPFLAALDTLAATGATPLAETLYEAGNYLRGGAVHYGLSANGGASHAGSRDGNRYRSPITDTCAKNHIVFLSDGQPNTDNDADDEINALLATTTLVDRSCANGDRYPAGFPIDNCLDELAGYLAVTDAASEATGNEVEGLQNITTHTIGFQLQGGEDLLRETARKGGGEYHRANNGRELAGAFSDIVDNILRAGTTFTAPAVSVNAFNRLAHRDELYFNVFSPDSRAHWDGNVKKFRLAPVQGSAGPVDADGDGETDYAIVDARGEAAVDAAGGGLSATARSLWTPNDFSPDGGNVRRGGLASRLFDYDDSGNRHQAHSREHAVYTLAGDGDSVVADLGHRHNRLHEDNAYIAGENEDGRITAQMIGQEDIDHDDFRRLLRWARGVDVLDENGNGDDDDGRAVLGASLHASPWLATYHVDGSTGVQQDYLFVITNDGFVHMASTATGESAVTDAKRLETWTFLPPDQLRTLPARFANPAADNIAYGLDGGMDLWIHDANGDGDLLDDDGKVDVGDHAYLYFGQRRGGSHYYALDVTDPARPRFLWSTSGDDGLAAAPLGRLGQSWSRPRHARIYDQQGDVLAARDVILFGGGYDTAQDVSVARTANDKGNAVYLLDATSGELLWWAGNGADGAGRAPDLRLAEMRYAIPADIRIIDVNGDGVLDRFYAADTGGQLWRFDVANDTVGPLSTRIRGGRIADLQPDSASTTPAEADNRRFYYPPDVSLVVPATGRPYHAIAIGSGHRAHPLGTAVDDRLYLVKDPAIQAPPTDENGTVHYRTRYPEDLLDVTDRLTFDNLPEAARQRLDNGWYIDLQEPGEKILSASVTAGGRVLVTAYLPPAADGAARCTPGQGSGRLYAVDAENGRPVADLDRGSGIDGGGLSRADRFLTLEGSGIPPGVSFVFPDPAKSSPIPLVGTQLVPELKLDNDPQRTWWYQDNVH